MDMNQALKSRRPIDPSLRLYLDENAPPALPSPPPADKERAGLMRQVMVKALDRRASIPGLPNAVETHDVLIGEALPARLYRPSDRRGPFAVLVYLHGGGWVAGSVDTHDPFCRLLSQEAGIIILSVDYRLAPEHPFPAALDDALDAYRWALEHVGDFGGDPKRLALGGDSAGANLAAVVANRLGEVELSGTLSALLLLYPVTDHHTGQHPSYVENATGYGLSADLMRWFWRQYAFGVPRTDPQVSPLRLEPLPVLPPTLVATAEYDPLRDEGVAYAEKLQAGGVAVTHLHADDMHHNFPVHPGTVARFPQSVEALKAFAAWLKDTLVASRMAEAGLQRVE
jgi:acetyl esterase